MSGRTDRDQQRYKLIVRGGARRAIAELLPLEVALAVGELLAGDLIVNPFRVGKQLYPPLDHLHSARRGEYRILYEIDEQRRIVTVESIRHRRDAYRT